MSRGVVFLSSVFKGLNETRSQVVTLLERLGYIVWWAEGLPWPEKPSSALIAATCLAGIDKSDFYLGIYPSRYGSDPLGVGFTELEYHHATGRRMPRFLYQLYDRVAQPHEQFIKQHGFLNLLRDSDISSIRPKRIESKKQLLEIIERDFVLLPQPSNFSQRPDFGVVLNAWKLFSGTNEETNTWKKWGQRLSALNEAAEVSLPTATTVGLAHLVQSLTEFTPNNREFLDRFDDYLNKWIGISAWSGIRGIFGQTNIAKVRICLAQLRGNYTGISALAGSVSSGLYADRKLSAAERWYDVYRRNGEAPEVRGAIALALGNVPLACTCFETVLARSNIDDAFASLHLGYYGQALASRGHFRRAIRESEKAIGVSHLPATVGTRVWRARSETLFLCHDNFGAQVAIDEAEKIALQGNLAGQVWKAQVARKKIARKIRALQ